MKVKPIFLLQGCGANSDCAEGRWALYHATAPHFMPHRPLASSPEPPPAPFRHVSWHFPLGCYSTSVLGLIKLIVFNLLGTNQPDSFYSSALGLGKLRRMASPFGWRPRWNCALCVMLSEFHCGARSAGFPECNVWRQNLLRALLHASRPVNHRYGEWWCPPPSHCFRSSHESMACGFVASQGWKWIRQRLPRERTAHLHVEIIHQARKYMDSMSRSRKEGWGDDLLTSSSYKH